MHFAYRLTGTGWAEACISDHASAVSIRASYLTDALGLLLKAVDQLLQGADEARCSWADEPGEYRWIIKRDRDHAHLRVLTFHDIESLEPDESGVVNFETKQPLHDVADAIAAGAQAVLDEYGVDGYLRCWASDPFPLVRLRAIQTRLHARGEIL